jgi:hypothetical protein
VCHRYIGLGYAIYLCGWIGWCDLESNF